MTAEGFLGELWVSIGVDSSGLANAQTAVQNFQRNVQSSVSTTNGSLNSLSNNLYRFGTFATMAFTLPLAALTTLSTKAAVDLEQIKQKTVALANVSQTQMDAWRGAIVSIGIATNQTSLSIAQALYFVSSAGVDNASAMRIVEAAAKGAAAGLGETETIAKLLTYTYNAYGAESFNVTKIMDSLTVAVREGAAEATDFAGVMGDLVPIGALLGVSFQQLAGSLAAMTQVGMNAHKSATALRQIMIQLIHPHHDAAVAMDTAAKKMGDSSIAARNLTNTIRNEGLLETLVKLKDAGDKMGPMFLPTVFSNVRAFTGVMAEIGPNLEKVRAIMKKTTEETGAFENALSIMTQTSSFKLGQFKKVVELAFIDFGNAILPTVIDWLQTFAKTIDNLTNWFKSLSPAMKSFVLDLGIGLAVIGPITIAGSGLVRVFALLGMAIPVLTTAWKILNAALIFTGEIMLANPFLAVVAATAALIPIMHYLLYPIQELNAHEKVLIDLNGQVSNSITNEKVAIEQLMRVATSENASKEQKEKAIKTINAISPAYLGNISEETIKTGEATKAIDKYIEALSARAKVQALNTMLVDLEKQRASDLMTGMDRELSLSEKAWAYFRYQKISEGDYMMKATENTIKYNSSKQAILKILDATLKKLKEMDDFEKGKAGPLPGLGGGGVAGTGELPEDNGELPEDNKDLDKALKKYNESLTSILVKMSLFKNEARQFGFELKLSFDFVTETLNAKRTYFDVLTEKGEGATTVVKNLAKEIQALQKRTEYQDQKTTLMSPVGNASLYENDKTNGTTSISLGWEIAGKELDQYSNYLGTVEIGTLNLVDTNKLLLSSAQWQNMSIDAADYAEYLKEINTITKDYYNSLDRNQTKAVGKGGSEYINPYKMQMDDLKAYLVMQKKLQDAAVQHEDWWGFLDAGKNIDAITKRMENLNAFQKFNDMFQKIGSQMNSIITSYTDIVKQKQQAAYDMIDAIAKREGKSAEWVTKKKADLDSDYNKKYQQMAKTQAIINGALAISAIWAHFTDPVSAAIETAFVTAATIASVATISGQKMAMGGIVPSGYSNDSYPALLSSGEAVIPPHKLPNLLPVNRNHTINLKGKLKVEGRDLVYVLDEMVVLQNAY